MGIKKGNGKKKSNRKKKSTRKQFEQRGDETINNCDDDGVCAAPSIGEWQQCSGDRDVSKTEDGSVEVDEVDAGYEKYWAEQGEYLLWEGWIGKYPDYMTQVGATDGIPAIREEEVCSEDISDITECRQAECVTVVNITDDIKEVKSGDMTDAPSRDNCDGATKKPPFSNLKCPTETFNNAVACTLARVTEVETNSCTDVSSDETNAQLIQEIHNYALSHVTDVPETDCGDTCQTSGDIWEALWTEHYTETYWYYYNQYRHWFGGGDQSQTNIKQLPVYTAHSYMLPPGEDNSQCADDKDALIETDAVKDDADDESLLHAMLSKCSITNNECSNETENSTLDFQHDENCSKTSEGTGDEEDDVVAVSDTREIDRCCDNEEDDVVAVSDTREIDRCCDDEEYDVVAVSDTPEIDRCCDNEEDDVVAVSDTPEIDRCCDNEEDDVVAVSDTREIDRCCDDEEDDVVAVSDTREIDRCCDDEEDDVVAVSDTREIDRCCDDEEDDVVAVSDTREIDRCCDNEEDDQVGSQEDEELSDGAGKKRRKKQKGSRTSGGRFIFFCRSVRACVHILANIICFCSLLSVLFFRIYHKTLPST